MGFFYICFSYENRLKWFMFNNSITCTWVSSSRKLLEYTRKMLFYRKILRWHCVGNMYLLVSKFRDMNYTAILFNFVLNEIFHKSWNCNGKNPANNEVKRKLKHATFKLKLWWSNLWNVKFDKFMIYDASFSNAFWSLTSGAWYITLSMNFTHT